MVFTFLKARGLGVGSSLVEEDKLDLAKELEEKAKKAGVEIILPSDVIVADAFAADAKTQVCVVCSGGAPFALCACFFSGSTERLASWHWQINKEASDVSCRGTKND